MIDKIVTEVCPLVSKVTIIISGTPEKANVAILCDAKKDGQKVKPITMSGPANELDAELAKAIQVVFTDNKELISNVNEVAADVKKTATKSTAKKSSTTTKKEDAATDDDKDEEEEEGTEDAPEVKPFKPNKDQKKAETAYKASLEKAQKSNDQDMINFLKKQTTESYDKAGMPEDVKAAMIKSFEDIVPAAGKTDLFNNGSGEKKEEKKAEAPAPAVDTTAKAVEEDPNVIF